LSWKETSGRQHMVQCVDRQRSDYSAHVQRDDNKHRRHSAPTQYRQYYDNNYQSGIRNADVYGYIFHRSRYCSFQAGQTQYVHAFLCRSTMQLHSQAFMDQLHCRRNLGAGVIDLAVYKAAMMSPYFCGTPTPTLGLIVTHMY